MDIKSAFFVCLTACIVFTTCFILIRCKGANVFSIILKSLASFCFVTTYLISMAYQTKMNGAIVAIGVGLVAGLIGDILLDAKVAYKEDSDNYLDAGFVSFGIGHIFYIFALISLAGKSWYVGDLALPISISLVIALVFTVGNIYLMKKIMKFDLGRHTVITAIYSFILSFVNILAIAFAVMNSTFVIFAIALTLFTISDLVLSMQYFGGKADNNVLQVINHASYYAAQILIAISMFVYLIA